MRRKRIELQPEQKAAMLELFAERVKVLKELDGLSLIAIADKTGIQRSTIRSMASGHTTGSRIDKAAWTAATKMIARRRALKSTLINDGRCSIKHSASQLNANYKAALFEWGAWRVKNYVPLPGKGKDSIKRFVKDMQNLPPPPCESCNTRDECATRLVACERFASYCEHGTFGKVQYSEPDRKTFNEVFFEAEDKPLKRISIVGSAANAQA